MKSSLYNLYFSLEDKYVVYNTLTDSILVVDEDLKEHLAASDLEGIETGIIQALSRCGIILPDNTDEKALLRYRYQRAKYSPDYISVLLLPTYACNLSCYYCPHPGDPVFMSPETTGSVITFLENLADSANLGIILKLYGGEPLLNVDCCLLLCKTLSSFCQSRNLPFLAAAMTNGTLLKHEKTEKLLPYLGAIHVTLDGSQPAHDSIRHYPDKKGTYEDIMEGLSLAREKNMRISVRINTTFENLGSIREVLNDLKKRKFDEYEEFEIYFGPIAQLDDCKYFEDDTVRREFKENRFKLAPQLREIVAASGWGEKIRDIISDIKGVSKPEQCEYGKSYHFIIDPLGKFYTCPGFCGNSDYCIGTLDENGNAEFTPLYYDLHTRDATQVECLTCEYMPLCGGGCPARARIHEGTVESVHCGSAKELTKPQILLYLQYKRPDLFRKSL